MSLPLGAQVALTGPHGFFVLDPVHHGDIVFGGDRHRYRCCHADAGRAGGAARGPAQADDVYWGLRQEADIFARDEIEALAARAGATLATHLTAPGPAWSGGRGRITPALLAELPELTSPTFYLVGNGAMITELKRELVSRGVNRKTQIRTEAFFD